MSRVLETISSFLRGLFSRGRRHRSAFDFPSIEFQTLDIDLVADQMRLRKKAIANGSKELPATASTQPDGPQSQIIQFIKGEMADVRAGFEVTLKGLNRKIDEIDIRHHTKTIDQLGSGLQRELDDLSHERRAAIEETREDYRKAEDDLRLFKLRNELDREPTYPESYALYVSLLVLVLVVEATVNAYFFQQGQAYGLSGGAVIALLLAAVDVLVVFTLGKLLIARIVSSRWYHRIPAVAGAIAFAGWAVFFNLLIAHVRESINVEMSLQQYTQLALDQFKENPFGLQQADSWMLFALVLVFSCLALISALNWDDKYPGYGSKHRRRNLTRREFRFHRDALVQAGAEAREEKLASLDSLLREAQNDLVVLKHDVETKDALPKAVAECIGHYEDSCEALIRRYRDENQSARTTPPPAYFDEPVSIDLPPPSSNDPTMDRDKVESQGAAYEDVMALASSIKEQLTGTYEEFLKREAALEPSPGPGLGVAGT